MNQTATPLQVALSAAQPIRTERRPVTVAHHEHFRRALYPQPPPGDDLDELAADPLTERYARPRKERETARILALLDELERGGPA